MLASAVFYQPNENHPFSARPKNKRNQMNDIYLVALSIVSLASIIAQASQQPPVSSGQQQQQTPQATTSASSIIHTTAGSQLQQHTTTGKPPVGPIEAPNLTPGAGSPETETTGDAGKRPPRRQQQVGDEYLVGVGIADITGPAADINLMGYAKPSQDSSGIHLRQFSRSIVVEDSDGQRVLYTSIDNGMISQLLRVQVLKRLKQNYGPLMFNESNVMMTATHSHSCPGGFFQYMLYNIPSAGFISQTLEALTDGIVRSVDRALESLVPARILFNEGELLEASINRSPTSYANNPAEERAQFKWDTDKQMSLLRFEDRSGTPIAMLNWFAVHGTSMNSSNRLISSDNKGYASLLFEQEMNGPEPERKLPGKGKFVAIFAQANEGDVSPNTRGPRCIDSGLPCDLATSTCGSSTPAADSPDGTASPAKQSNERCVALGPGRDMFESTKIIAHKQYQRARQLFEDRDSLRPLTGPIRFVHEHIDMTKQQVPLYKNVIDLAHRQKLESRRSIRLNASYSTCPAALGYSFAAGTTDGPGAFDFQQGDTASSRYWNMVRDFLRRPSAAQIKCHRPKPILLSTGEMDFPYMWHPKVVPTQIIMIGQLAIVGLPGEFTTMAGRRVRQAVRSTLASGASRPIDPFEGSEDHDETDDAATSDDDYEASDNATQRADKRRQRLVRLQARGAKQQSVVATGSGQRSDIKVVLSGLSNIYTSYVTTLEEYEIQRYEGASTLYGPHTLQAYVNQFRRLAAHLVSREPLQPPGSGPLQPPDLTKSLFTLKPGVIFDGTQHGRTFGDLLQDVNSSHVYRCQDLVSVNFAAGNPRNDLRQEDSYLYVDRYTGNGTWQTVATDGSWETKFIWERTNTFFGESKATVLWDIPHDCQTGFYRIRHYGAHKSLLQTISQYAGQSSLFRVYSQQQPSNEQQPVNDGLIMDEQLHSMIHLNGSILNGSQSVARSKDPRQSEPLRRGFAMLTGVIRRFL